MPGQATHAAWAFTDRKVLQMAAMTKPELTELVGQLVKDCEDYRDQLSATRVRADRKSVV